MGGAEVKHWEPREENGYAGDERETDLQSFSSVLSSKSSNSLSRSHTAALKKLSMLDCTRGSSLHHYHLEDRTRLYFPLDPYESE